MQRPEMIVLVMSAIALLSCAVDGAQNVNITVLESVVSKGAVCLDGSPPSYAFSPGFGDGADNWHVHLQGGGWCWSSRDCFNRSLTNLGSSTKLMTAQRGKIAFDGLLENNATFNPNFYNWNVVFIFYCDGSSFMSDVEEVDPVYNITYRGARIYDAVMKELLLRKGMRNAKNALLSGSSAGGLAAILHCDKFRALFPKDNYSIRVKCLSDSGFFIQGEGFLGADWREILFFSVISTHGLANLLPTSCLAKFSPTLCLFSENLVPDVQTPLFLIESSFDQFQISAQLFSPNNITKRWFNCTNNLMFCNWTEIKIMQDFQTIFINILKNAIGDSYSNRGYFVHSCYRHVHILTKDYSTCSSLIGSNILARRTVAQAVGDWYLDRSNFREIDNLNDLPRNCSSTYPGQPSGPDFDLKCSHALQLSDAPPKQLVSTYFFFIVIIGVSLLISHVNVRIVLE